MDDDQTTIFTYISLAFLCVVLFLYITYGKNLMKVIDYFSLFV